MAICLFLLILSIFGTTFSIRITCIGDSISKRGSCATTSYSQILQDLLGETATITNAGVPASTMLKSGLCSQTGPTCSYWDSNGWKIALKSRPDIVTIMLGTNDARSFNWEGVQQSTGDYYALDYVDMIKQLRILQPSPEIFILVPPPLYDPSPFKMNATIINEIFPKLIRNIAAVTETRIIDIYTAFRESERSSSSSTLICDGCHPTDDGHRIIANTIHEALQMFSSLAKSSAYLF